MVPPQVPLVAVSVDPDWVVPEMVGTAVLEGATAIVAEPLPAAPKIEPMAIADSASRAAAAKRLPRNVFRFIGRYPLFPRSCLGIDEAKGYPPWKGVRCATREDVVKPG